MMPIVKTACAWMWGVVFLAASSSPAAVHVFSFPLDGLQENPDVITTGTGTGQATYNDVSNLLTWDIDYTSLSSNSTAAHFHGPAAVGVNAGVQVNMASADSVTQADLGATSGSFIGSHTLSAGQETDLLAGLWYVNIHSVNHGGGEIRGQVVPEPGALGVCLGGMMLGLLRRRR